MAAGARLGLPAWCFHLVPMTPGVLAYFAVETNSAFAALGGWCVAALVHREPRVTATYEA